MEMKRITVKNNDGGGGGGGGGGGVRESERDTKESETETEIYVLQIINFHVWRVEHHTCTIKGVSAPPSSSSFSVSAL